MFDSFDKLKNRPIPKLSKIKMKICSCCKKLKVVETNEELAADTKTGDASFCRMANFLEAPVSLITTALMNAQLFNHPLRRPRQLYKGVLSSIHKCVCEPIEHHLDPAGM